MYAVWKTWLIVNNTVKKFEYPLLFILFFCLGLIVYSHAFNGSFYFDDKPYILEFPALKSWGSLWEFFFSIGFNKIRFIPLLTFYFNILFFGYETWAFRLTNLLIHSFNAILVYWLCHLLLKNHPHNTFKKPGIMLFSFGVSLLFFIHPVQENSSVNGLIVTRNNHIFSGSPKPRSI